MDWRHILAYVTGTVDQELLTRNEYLAAENRILKRQLNGRLRLSDAERAMLGKIGDRLGRQALAEVTTVARPDTAGYPTSRAADRAQGQREPRLGL
jgi:putative transposase